MYIQRVHENYTYINGDISVTRKKYSPIDYTFYVTLYSCVYWDEAKELWTGEGCRIKVNIYVHRCFIQD